MSWFRKGYMNWDSYKTKIDFLDDLHWQQRVREENIRNSKSF